MSTLPAAAIRAGNAVVIDGTPQHVIRVDNSTPFPGQITWHLGNGAMHIVGGAQPVATAAVPTI